MIASVLGANNLSLIRTKLFLQHVAVPCCIVGGKQRNWLGALKQGKNAIVVYTSIRAFSNEVSELEAWSKLARVVVLDSDTHLAEYNLKVVPDHDWSETLLELVLSYTSGVPEKVNDALAALTTLRDYPASQVMRDVHPLFYRVADKEQRTMLQREVWGWLSGISNKKPNSGIPAMQRVLDSSHAVTLRNAVIHSRTHQKHETLEKYPEVDEYAINYLRTVGEPKRDMKSTRKKA